MNQIKPTIGRIVLYTIAAGDADFDGNGRNSHGEPLVLPAVIVRVWTDTCVNLKVLNDGPTDVWKTSVTLKPEGSENVSGFWEWMPYQIGQAAKHDEIVHDLAGGNLENPWGPGYVQVRDPKDATHVYEPTIGVQTKDKPYPRSLQLSWLKAL